MTASKELAVAGGDLLYRPQHGGQVLPIPVRWVDDRTRRQRRPGKIGGLLKRAPWLATLFLIAALSLAGLPPLSGFFGKWVLIKEGFNQQWWWLTGFALATSLLTLLSMLKIWSYGFWSPAQGKHVDQPDRQPQTVGGLAAITILVVMALTMGLGLRRT